MRRRSNGIDRDRLFAAQVAAVLPDPPALPAGAYPPAPGAPVPVGDAHAPSLEAVGEQARVQPIAPSLPRPADAPDPAVPGLSEWAQATVVLCLGAHPQAGTSTVAVAVADAGGLAEAVTGVRLVDGNLPHLSGLSWAPEAELGLDPGGDWSEGRRAGVHLLRRAGPARRPAVSPPAAGSLQVLDGAATAELIPPSVAMRLVLVCRASLPSLRAAEARLTDLPVDTLHLAVLGPARWPGVLTAALGPGVSRLREAGRVIAVPIDKQLEITGITSRPLPKHVLQAGVQLLQACTTSPRSTAASSPEEGIHG